MMAQTANSVKLCDGTHWVGSIDWNVRDFHGYSTDHGTTYNAYLLRDEKTALIDTVKEPYGSQLLEKIAALAEPSSVDYVVSNHAEPDHTGAMPRVMEALPNATLLCDKRCAATLAQHFDTSGWKTEIVATGDTVSLGRRTLQFLETPMVHWPESMFTYVPEDKLLFSMDAFGQHYATSGRFDDELPLSAVMEEAKAYYANIVVPFGKQVAKVLGQVAGFDVEMIAPSHGVIWRSHVGRILEAYEHWSVCRPKPKVLVIYDTMWESTGRMAEAIAEGASSGGVEVVLLHIRHTSLTRIATEVLDAAAVAIGSSTLNRGMMPAAAAALAYLKGLRPGGKAGFAFGSYGWGSGRPEGIHGWLEEMKWEIVRQPLSVQYRPTPAVLDECRQAGTMLAGKARSLAQVRGETSNGKVHL